MDLEVCLAGCPLTPAAAAASRFNGWPVAAVGCSPHLAVLRPAAEACMPCIAKNSVTPFHFVHQAQNQTTHVSVSDILAKVGPGEKALQRPPWARLRAQPPGRPGCNLCSLQPVFLMLLPTSCCLHRSTTFTLQLPSHSLDWVDWPLTDRQLRSREPDRPHARPKHRLLYPSILRCRSCRLNAALGWAVCREHRWTPL
jgi:hypothetical protein